MFSNMVRPSLVKYFKPTRSREMFCRDLWYELSGGLKKKKHPKGNRNSLFYIITSYEQRNILSGLKLSMNLITLPNIFKKSGSDGVYN